MEKSTSHLEINIASLSRELEELDRLVHRVKACLLPHRAAQRYAIPEAHTVLQRTAGTLKHKIAEDVIAWQRCVREEWK